MEVLSQLIPGTQDDLGHFENLTFLEQSLVDMKERSGEGLEFELFFILPETTEEPIGLAHM